QRRDPRGLSEYRAVLLRRLWHRDGGTHLLRHIRGRPRRATKRNPRRDVEGHLLLQSCSKSRTCASAAKCGAPTNGEEGIPRRVGGGVDGGAADPPVLSEAGAGTEQGPTFHRASPKVP